MLRGNPHQRCGYGFGELRIVARKQAHAFKHVGADAFDAASAEVGGQAAQQPLAVLRPVFAVLLELDDIGADDPVAQNKGLVDRGRSAPDAFGVQSGDGLNQGVIIHCAASSRRLGVAPRYRHHYALMLDMKGAAGRRRGLKSHEGKTLLRSIRRPVAHWMSLEKPFLGYCFDCPANVAQAACASWPCMPSDGKSVPAIRRQYNGRAAHSRQGG